MPEASQPVPTDPTRGGAPPAPPARSHANGALSQLPLREFTDSGEEGGAVRRLRYALLLAAVLAVIGCNSRSYSSGDRVLVNKFIYESGLSRPQRFEVVVFKT